MKGMERSQNEFEIDDSIAMELDVLDLISKQDHANLITLIQFYTWRDEVNFIFPFVPGNLEKLFAAEWKPKPQESSGKVPHHWLWKQMVGVADGLRTIHVLDVHQWDPTRGRTIGFHFDLKPANILITSNGILKITDFGQSMIKLVRPGAREYGTFTGGDPAYQAPEGLPARPKIFDKWKGLKNSKETPVSIGGTGSLEGRHIDVTSNFDVWSLACIMLEVLVFIEEETEGYLSFRKDRGNGTFLDDKGGLKDCVTRRLTKFCGTSLSPPDIEFKEPSYRGDVVSLLQEMFSISPEDRPTSTDVCEKLESIKLKYPGIDDTEAEILKILDGEKVEDKFIEAGWLDEHGVNSFSRMYVFEFFFFATHLKKGLRLYNEVHTLT